MVIHRMHNRRDKERENRKKADEAIIEINKRQKIASGEGPRGVMGALAEAAIDAAAKAKAIKKAEYDALSPHQKKYSQEPNDRVWQLLVEGYQKDEYSLEESIEFAYAEYMGNYDDAITPREKRIGAEWEQIAIDHRNAHYLSLENTRFKKRANELISKGSKEKAAHADLLKENLASENEFTQKYSKEFTRAIEFCEKNVSANEIKKILRDILKFSNSEINSFLSIYSETYRKKKKNSSTIVFLAFVAVACFPAYFSLVGNDFNQKLTNIIGKGTFNYALPSKDKYVGEVLDNMRHGQGKYIWENGEEFIGEWQKGALVKGTYTSNDGSVYVGEFKDDTGGSPKALTGYFGKDLKDFVPEGQGTLTSDGSVYVGEFKDGYQHGQGTLTTEKGTRFTGGFKEGNLHGEVIVSYDGASAKFKFLNGERIK